jgi:hypothetical protein
VQGLAVVQFDGVNDLMTGAVGGVSTDLTVVAVVKFASVASGGGVLELATAGGGTRCLALFQESSAIKLRLTGSPNALASQVTYAFSDTSGYHLLVGTHDTASRSLRQDGVAKATTTYTDPLPATPSEYQVGSLYPPSYPLPGSLAELLLYDRVLPPSELAMVERSLGARYGLAIP